MQFEILNIENSDIKNSHISDNLGFSNISRIGFSNKSRVVTFQMIPVIGFRIDLLYSKLRVFHVNWRYIIFEWIIELLIFEPIC